MASASRDSYGANCRAAKLRRYPHKIGRKIVRKSDFACATFVPLARQQNCRVAVILGQNCRDTGAESAMLGFLRDLSTGRPSP
jgi:hypothetical protein